MLEGTGEMALTAEKLLDAVELKNQVNSVLSA